MFVFEWLGGFARRVAAGIILIVVGGLLSSILKEGYGSALAAVLVIIGALLILEAAYGHYRR